MSVGERLYQQAKVSAKVKELRENEEKQARDILLAQAEREREEHLQAARARAQAERRVKDLTW